MRIRPANANEADLIAWIHEATAAATYGHIFPGQPFPHEESLVRWRSFTGRIMVAEERGQVVGFVAVSQSELHALYVLPGCQGRGAGSRLLAAAGDVSHLWVLKDNRAARRFYEAHGWAPEGSERGAYGVMEILYCLPPQSTCRDL